ncbi:MAG: SIS domain-containing protein [Candidatus Liptonbacteria bacterium]|nr:SIS domain-containing protein [Candidatus Liptonbacteria bacterium]
MSRRTYPNFILKEIFEIPEVLEKICRETFEFSGKVRSLLRGARRVIFVGCGTSYHAGMLGQIFFEELAGIPTLNFIASEFNSREPIFQKGDLVVVISQSGETAETLVSMKLARENKLPILAVVNNSKSSMAKRADVFIDTAAGKETAVAATKSFMAQMAAIFRMAIFLGEQRRKITFQTKARLEQAFSKLPDGAREILSQSGVVKRMVLKYQKRRQFFFVGRKLNYPIAFEGAMKLKETSYLHGEGVATGELRHGPMAMVDRNLLLIFLIPKDSVYEKNLSVLREARKNGGQVVAIATEGDRVVKRYASEVIYIPKTLEVLSPFLTVIPLQLLAYFSAEVRGYNVDKPRNLAKWVTTE